MKGKLKAKFPKGDISIGEAYKKSGVMANSDNINLAKSAKKAR